MTCPTMLYRDRSCWPVRIEDEGGAAHGSRVDPAVMVPRSRRPINGGHHPGGSPDNHHNHKIEYAKLMIFEQDGRIHDWPLRAIRASGGRVRLSDCDWPCQWTGVATTPPMFPWPLPP